MSDIFNEVDEAIREDQWRALWNRFGGYVIGVALAIVLATAGNQFWKSYQQDQREEAAILYLSGLRALDEDKREAALGQFAKLTEGGHEGYAALALHEQASDALRHEDAAQSIAVLDSIADNGGISDELRAIASIKAAMLAMDVEEPDAVLARLTPLATEGAAYEHLARELKAAVAYKMGDADTARTEFTALVQDAMSPFGVRQRSLEMMVLLGPGEEEATSEGQEEQAAETSDEENGDSAQ